MGFFLFRTRARFHLCLLLVLIPSLSGCGFHLRTIEGFNLDVESVHISATNAYGEFLRELERILSVQGVKIAPKSSAEYTIHISSEQRSRRPVSTSAGISVSEYELRLETVFEVAGQDGKVLIEPTMIVTEKIYSFDRSSFIGSSEEEKRLVEEMRRDIAGQLLRRFNASLRNIQSTAAIR
ncbi:MAG TPA: hypothetical protein EYG51_17130 [Pseudomonadales bacterium]|nr:hypothetical protein [Pseudomonadales bacterium]